MASTSERTPVGLAQIEAAARSGAWVAFSCSGGKDSSAAMLEATRQLDAWNHPRERRFILHADLGRAEWRSTPAHVQYLADTFRLPLHVVRHHRHDMVSRWQRRGDLGRERWARYETVRLIGPWSSSSLRFCTGEMKNHVMGAFKAKLDGPIVSILGLRRDESIGRRHTPVAKIDASMRRYGRGEGDLLWNPVADWTTQQVFDAHHARGIALHEAYELGATRLSCNYCVLASINDLTVASSHEDNRDTYHALVAMEASYGFSFQPGRWLGDVAPTLLSRGLARDLSIAKERAKERKILEASYPVGLATKPYSAIGEHEAIAISAIRTRLAVLYGMTDAVIAPEMIMAIHENCKVNGKKGGAA